MVALNHLLKVLGPFPQEAREQHFLNPGNPLDSDILLSLDFTKIFPSHLADNGFVNWINSSVSNSLVELEDPTRENTDSVHYSIVFPEIRWDSIRATEGWSGLQHHALLHTKIQLTPPQHPAAINVPRPNYLVLSASQCSYITVFDSRQKSPAPQWYACNIYDHSDVPPIRIPLKSHFGSYFSRQNASSSTPETLELSVFMSLDYEIRLFGDPTVFNNGTMPIIQADLSVKVEAEEQYLPDITETDILDSPTIPLGQVSLPEGSPSQRDPCILVNHGACIFPHFVDGWAYGDAIGIEVTSCSEEYWSINLGASYIDALTNDYIQFELAEPTRIAPSQTRLVSMNLVQNKPLMAPNASLILELYLHAESPSHRSTHINTTTIPIRNHPELSQLPEDTQGILLTYHSVSGTPASAVVLPPPKDTHQITARSRILLALHGAGVMHTHPFWISSLPRPEHTWVLVVQGLTPWGLDWREASRADVCAVLRALVLRLVGTWREDDYCTTHDLVPDIVLPNRSPIPATTIPVVAIGHSNGGQGSLHLASSFPDCIPALIPAAGYTSARLYVPTQASRGSLFADATLQGIMRASLQGQDGDIIAGNLALSRVHLVHGGNDENVPVWHSRERMALIKTWNPNADVNMTEVPGKPHFWDTVFKDQPISGVIEELVAPPYTDLDMLPTPFTLTVVWPSESGSMRGWRIREATVPGRLSRIQVNGNSVGTTNVHTLSIELSKSGLKASSLIILDHQSIEIPDRSFVWLYRGESKQWKITGPITSYPSGPLSSILTSAKPIALVIPAEHAEYYEIIALRIAHNLYTYLKLDCTILHDSEVDGTLEGRSVVIIGGHHNQYGMATRSSPLRVSSDESISIAGERYSGAGIGALSLHKRHLYMDAFDPSGYERILRMFPLRTGVPGPEWMIVGPDCDKYGFGGALAAGFWDRNGGLSESMSYFS
ncbi:Guanine nucleotide exchange factor LTE1 [Kluyveromyces lactis NRRL Y-1140] [Rhizoctonia solani]|uniref:Guanine nucleotide exchange factor LTE1 [Kluyveromyces lactis NRRL Y-1140] n=1 Tax=Rhizoctonia solani TaxID=456999 RepID=A0A0K6FP51_9AGAM|nr:Guanine nucleotide exchange factor LTE1 [Kluyveromyces lactis NRRL Y-1140] [Rhizoctonia solani]